MEMPERAFWGGFGCHRNCPDGSDGPMSMLLHISGPRQPHRTWDGALWSSGRGMSPNYKFPGECASAMLLNIYRPCRLNNGTNRSSYCGVSVFAIILVCDMNAWKDPIGYWPRHCTHMDQEGYMELDIERVGLRDGRRLFHSSLTFLRKGVGKQNIWGCFDEEDKHQLHHQINLINNISKCLIY